MVKLLGNAALFFCAIAIFGDGPLYAQDGCYTKTWPDGSHSTECPSTAPMAVPPPPRAQAPSAGPRSNRGMNRGMTVPTLPNGFPQRQCYFGPFVYVPNAPGCYVYRGWDGYVYARCC